MIMAKTKTSSFPTKWILYFLAIFVFALYIVPFILIILNSLKNEVESSVLTMSLPSQFMFENYVEAFKKGQIWRGFVNGMFLSTVVTSLTVLLCALSAFIIQRNKNKFTKFTYQFLLTGMIAPFSFIPAIKLLDLLHMDNNFSGIIMVNLAAQIPFTILLYVGFMGGIPRELDEASFMDGCKPLNMFFRVIFPLLKPVISTNIVLTFTSIWNEFGNVLFLVPKSSMWTMPMSVMNFQGFHTYSYNLVCAYIVMALIPVMIIYIAVQKYIVSGMIAGAIKG